MSHTIYAQSRLAEAARLRQLAAELDKGIDRRHGAFGFESTSEAAALRQQARDIEAAVVIPVRQIPNFPFHVRDCTAAWHERERIRILAGAAPRIRQALEDIDALRQPGRFGAACSLWPPKPIYRPHA